jgi:uncharacterized membrane protein YeaQ/YmgE (transglycosylase-associated protein family)
MQFIWFIVVGFLAGLIARAIMPGRQSMSLTLTTVLGIVGSFVGGLFASLIHGQGFTLMRSSGIVGSVIGALIVLAVYLAISRHRSHHAAA